MFRKDDDDDYDDGDLEKTLATSIGDDIFRGK